MGPWWDVDADAALGGYTRIHNVALVNWPQQDDCGCRHFAIAPNPSSGDLSPTTFVSAAALSNVSSGAQYHSPPPDPELVNFEDCVDFECTGLSHAVLVDTDGSLTGAPASVVRGDTALVTGDSRAVYNELMDAIVVTGGSYRELYFESLDPDRMSRRVQPVAVTGAGAAAGRSSSARLNCFEDHLWDFDYTSLLRMSRFAATVELGGNYTITYAGTPPQQQQFSMSGNAPEEGVLIRLKCAGYSLVYLNGAVHQYGISIVSFAMWLRGADLDLDKQRYLAAARCYVSDSRNIRQALQRYVDMSESVTMLLLASLLAATINAWHTIHVGTLHTSVASLGKLARVVTQPGWDLGLHQHVSLRVQSVPVVGGVPMSFWIRLCIIHTSMHFSALQHVLPSQHPPEGV